MLIRLGFQDETNRIHFSVNTALVTSISCGRANLFSIMKVTCFLNHVNIASRLFFKLILFVCNLQVVKPHRGTLENYFL